jgi:VIT1/CCC1 family predicted Fe2+/Mn2+ transporter
MTWPNVVNALIGLWFVIAPFVLGYSGQTGAMWTSIVGGAILFVLGGVGPRSTKTPAGSGGCST